MLIAIGKKAYGYYRSLYENENLLPIIQNATPYRCIPFSNWGSRPAIRWDPNQKFSLGELRAIPWVVTWNQIRMMIPGWYATGLAINDMLDDKSLTLAELQKMYKEFDAFRIEIDHCEMALAKSNMHAASLYGELLPPGSLESELFQSMLDEHLRTVYVVNKIKGNNRLLDSNPTIQNRIDERNKYTHLINYMQVKLLRELFEQFKTDPDAKNDKTREVLDLVLRSMKGNGAALQETG